MGLVVLLRLAHGFGQRRNYLEHITYDSVIGDFKNGRVLVLVDRNDRPRRSHSREMLDSAGDPNRDVKLWAHESSGLADLITVRPPAVVGDRARRADRRVSECRGEIVDQL